MNFDKAVKERANQRVQARIKTFHLEVMNAASKLLQDNSANNPSDYFREYGQQYGDSYAKSVTRRAILETVLAPTAERKWPALLWRKEEETVSKELLATMDEMHKAYLAAKTPRSCDEAQESGTNGDGE